MLGHLVLRKIGHSWHKYSRKPSIRRDSRNSVSNNNGAIQRPATFSILEPVACYSDRYACPPNADRSVTFGRRYFESVIFQRRIDI